ncbi:unnamed protein product [Rotaria sp. Silwood2]|nr:unnamed protein product [Rotaria sp. Silwood2]CAF4568338.1 unnamed protein product [Rotaria sp. Silwood2]
MSIVRESYFSTKLNPEEHENLEDITIVWFDKTVDQSDDCIQFQSRIRHVINYLVVFDDCTAFDGEYLVSTVHHVSEINSIYVFCFEKIRHKEWTKNYAKIRGMYDNKDELLKTLTEDARICLFEILPMRALGIKAMQKTLKELNEEGGLFIWSHFLIHILCNMQHDNSAKNDLLDLSRQQYIDNNEELIKISDFEENYTTDKAI